MLGFQGGVSIPLVKGGVKAPPAKRQCRAGPKAGARRGFTLGFSSRPVAATVSRTFKVRGGIISQANRYLSGFCSSQRIFPPQIIQVLLVVPCDYVRYLSYLGIRMAVSGFDFQATLV
jgi:hypothetical protein